MASMTDVVFLLLIFFMVTSNFVFPTGMDINLPQSTEQTPLKPSTRIYVVPDGSITVAYGDEEPRAFETEDDMVNYIRLITEQDPETAVAIYADSEIEYGRVIDVLNIGARENIKMVLATVPGDKVNAKVTHTDDNATVDDAAKSTTSPANGQ